MKTPPTLSIRRLAAGYGAIRVIDELSLDIPAGSRVALLGRNGMGKTTLLASLMGLTRRFGGEVLLDTRDISGLSTTARAAAGLGYVPQTRDIFASLTVEENLMAGLKGRPRSAVQEAYAMFPRLAERKKNLGIQLSGGEQQMLSTARTLLGQPSILLLDEPLEGLAPVVCDELMTSLIALTQDRSMTTILVEQQIDRALDYADVVLIIEHGHIAWSGQASAMREDPSLVDRYLGVGVH
ncbi:ABC transporter ATP-binding protein [Pigmentiphaga litoralis]|uniref:ABC transporter ATP-binding protein n=1 Tax=Pigmentiphaga litoralis TaxID=516702 RepID=UPI001672083A|nr:ABC transporter ATP-binding protein [Pigmentiphaga litoralis]GGX30781.1 ABC transporter ATP-binding protein [Pigmentiphaga litoralis]